MSDKSIVNFLNILEEKGVKEKAIVISFDHNTLNLIREHSDISLQYIFDKRTFTDENFKVQIDTVSKINNADIDVCIDSLSKKSIEYAHRAGLKVNAWTIKDLNTFNSFKKLNVDFLTTNIFIDE